MKRFAAGLVLMFLSASPVVARADAVQECVDAYKQGQMLRKKGDYTAAREQLLVCSRESCPAIVKHDCVPWLGEMTRGIASIVITAKDPRGNPIEACTVTIDGKVVATHLDNRPIDVSPGARSIRIEADGAPADVRTVTLGEGEKNHAVQVVLSVPDRPKEAQPTTVTTRPIPAGAIALGVIGLLGMGTYATMGLMGLSQKSSLDSCKPSCNPSDVDQVRTLYIGADVAAGVGGAALVGALVWFLLRPEQTTTVTAAALPGGGLFSVTRRF